MRHVHVLLVVVGSLAAVILVGCESAPRRGDDPPAAPPVAARSAINPTPGTTFAQGGLELVSTQLSKSPRRHMIHLKNVTDRTIGVAITVLWFTPEHEPIVTFGTPRASVEFTPGQTRRIDAASPEPWVTDYALVITETSRR